jgi:hypothetical protein
MVEDAEIDDIELLLSKKHLCMRHSPVSIVKTLMDKHKEVTFEEELSFYKHALLNQLMYVATVQLKETQSFGKAEDINKQKARQIAC